MFEFPDPNSGVTYEVCLKILKLCVTSEQMSMLQQTSEQMSRQTLERLNFWIHNPSKLYKAPSFGEL